MSHRRKKYLDVSNKQLTAKDVAKLLNRRLIRLDIANNQLSDEGARILATSKRLVYLNLANNWIRDYGTVDLAANCSITHLNLSHNFLDKESIAALSQNRTLRILHLNNCRLGKCRIELLASMPQLEELSLIDNYLEQRDAIRFAAAAAAAAGSLTSLNWSSNSIDNQGAAALTSITSLTSLTMSKCHLSSDYWNLRPLPVMPRLTKLDLGGNNLTKAYLIDICRSPTLTHLNLNGNYGMPDVEWLLTNSRIMCLSLVDTRIATSALASLAARTPPYRYLATSLSELPVNMARIAQSNIPNWPTRRSQLQRQYLLGRVGTRNWLVEDHHHYRYINPDTAARVELLMLLKLTNRGKLVELPYEVLFMIFDYLFR